MTRISLIGTYHEEKGLITAAALLEILERIRPEVIFLEMHSDDYYDFFGYSGFSGIAPRRNLESTAAIGYGRCYRVVLVPVDLQRPGEDFFQNYTELDDILRNTSDEYRRIDDQRIQEMRAHGFAYLNSAKCGEAWANLHTETLAALSRIGDHRLDEIYQVWRRTHEDREVAWIKNIYNHCEHHPVERGALLVGAAHRQPIIEKLRAVEWDFSGVLAPQ